LSRILDVFLNDQHTLDVFLSDQHNVRDKHCQCFAFGPPIRLKWGSAAVVADVLVATHTI